MSAREVYALCEHDLGIKVNAHAEEVYQGIEGNKCKPPTTLSTHRHKSWKTSLPFLSRGSVASADWQIGRLEAYGALNTEITSVAVFPLGHNMLTTIKGEISSRETEPGIR